MRISVEKLDKVCVLHINGTFDADTVTHFKQKVSQLLGEGCFSIVVDCDKLQFVDSMGLGALISLLRRVRTQKGDLKIAGLNADVRNVFEITRLQNLFEITPDWKAACEKFCT